MSRTLRASIGYPYIMVALVFGIIAGMLVASSLTVSSLNSTDFGIVFIVMVVMGMVLYIDVRRKNWAS